MSNDPRANELKVWAFIVAIGIAVGGFIYWRTQEQVEKDRLEAADRRNRHEAEAQRWRKQIRPPEPAPEPNPYQKVRYRAPELYALWKGDPKKFKEQTMGRRVVVDGNIFMVIDDFFHKGEMKIAEILVHAQTDRTHGDQCMTCRFVETKERPFSPQFINYLVNQRHWTNTPITVEGIVQTDDQVRCQLVLFNCKLLN